MSDVPAHFKAPRFPQVNLIPAEVNQKREKKRRRATAFLLLALLIAAIAVGYVWLVLQVASAEERAATEAARTAELQSQIAALTEVDEIKAKIVNAESARQFAAANEIYWPLVFASIDGALPEGVVPTEILHQFTPLGQTPQGPTGPFDVAGVGTLTITLDVPAYVDASVVQDSFNGVPIFTRAYVTAVRTADEAGAAEAEGAEAEVVAAMYTIDLQVTVTYDALTQRYSPRWFGTDDTGTESLLDYYRSFASSIALGQPGPTEFPPMPPTTIPPFVPGTSGTVPEAPPTDPSATPSPTPSPEVAE